MDRYVVFADIVNKANRANGKVMVKLDTDTYLVDNILNVQH